MILTALNSKRRLSNEHGQSLILAIIVMFLLVFIGVVFVLLVARNQGRAGRSRDVLEAQYLAEAGIQYADTQLRTSEEGADWRPEPDNLGFIYDEATGDYNLDPAWDLADLAENHPDFKWLRPYWPTERDFNGVQNAMGPTGGYTSFKTGEGRYLLRVSYNPDPNDPMSKYIKIESIGRIGVVDKDDPTTWSGQVRLRRELTAYKPIGVTDYARFITNKEKRSAEIPLGAAGHKVRFGYYNSLGDFRGAPIRVNGNLTWYGSEIEIILRGKTYPDRETGGSQFLPIDMVEVAGKIRHDKIKTSSGSQPLPVILREIVDNGAAVDNPVYPSDGYGSNPFTTRNGFYRDGSSSTDRQHHARGIKRLEPPLIESNDSKVRRYIQLTRDSGVWVNGPNGNVNSGRYGWGRGVYIDNTDDLQPKSERLFGGYTPRNDWMKPNNDMASYWQGPYYVPPAVVITLNPYDTDGDDEPDITITRTDVKSRSGNSQYGQKAVWCDAAGNPMHDKGSTITIPYPQGTQTFEYYDGSNTQTITIERNGVIYAEGNIRIRGMMAENKQLTIVSGGIIYVDGNLLKYRYENGRVDQRCAIALLAKEHVCVNTTQFVSLLNSIGPASIGSDAGTGQPPYHLIITPEPATTFFSTFSFGPPTGSWSLTDDVGLFVRHAGQYGPAYMTMKLNNNFLPIGQGGPLDNLGMPFGEYVYGVGDPRYPGAAPGVGISSLFEQRTWALNNGLNRRIGMPNYFEVALDQSVFVRNNYLLSSFTIQPMDIRIEAIMYAQNDSFFIIPGNWFNLNATDIPGSNGRNGTRRPNGVDPSWPFFGDPLDTKITIDGAITENLPASVADVSEWYSKWSNIPPNYGSSDRPTAHPGDGLTFLYDPMLGWPVYDDGGRLEPVRKDKYGRALPITPRLPVCESLYYYGEPT